jgi:hypothetical protein
MIDPERLGRLMEDAIGKLHGNMLDVKIVGVETKDQKISVQGIFVEYDQITTKPFVMRVDQNGKLLDLSLRKLRKFEVRAWFSSTTGHI